MRTKTQAQRQKYKDRISRIKNICQHDGSLSEFWGRRTINNNKKQTAVILDISSK